MSIVSRWRRKPAAKPSFSTKLAKGYEQLADNVLSQKAQRPLQTLAVASSVCGEGASTVAAGLAIALAQKGAGEILLVDCNLRSPSLHRRLGVEGKPGLADAILSSLGAPSTGGSVPPRRPIGYQNRPHQSPGLCDRDVPFRLLRRARAPRADPVTKPISGAPSLCPSIHQESTD